MAVNQLRHGEWTEHRAEAGTPVVQDVANDATNPSRRALLNCEGYDDVMVYPIVVGAGGKVDIEVNLYDPELDSFAVLTTFDDVLHGEINTFQPRGHRVYLRMSQITATPTIVKLRVAPGNVALG